MSLDFDSDSRESARDDPRSVRQLKCMQALADQQAERVRAMLAQHDVDELLAPVMALAPESEQKTKQ